MKRILSLAVLCALLAAIPGFSKGPDSVADRLLRWQTGVWMNPGGTYTIWTETHYFVVQGQMQGDSANVYSGASQVVFTEKGIARRQIVRVRKTPGQGLVSSTYQDYLNDRGMESPLVIDEAHFKPGQCVITDGTIYDSVEEVADDYILLSTCNGDKIRLQSDGVSVYLPAGGGEYRSYRIETF